MQTYGDHSNSKGFTLLEVMVVIFLIGVATSIVLFNAFSASQSDRLKEQVQRLQVVFDMASDFAILNQQQLGLYVDQEAQTYHFALLDDEQRWQPITDQDAFSEYQLPEPFTLELVLDDLPWQDEDSLFDRGVFDESLSVSEDGVEIGEDDAPPPPPQVLIMSSGDITPFSLVFSYEPEFGEDVPVYFRLNGAEATPLERQGPLDQVDN